MCVCVCVCLCACARACALVGGAGYQGGRGRVEGQSSEVGAELGWGGEGMEEVRRERGTQLLSPADSY